MKSLDINLLFETKKSYFILVFTVIKDCGTLYYLSDFAMSVLILHLNWSPEQENENVSKKTTLSKINTTSEICQ